MVFALALMAVTYGAKHPYAGPKTLGLFRIDKDISMNSLFQRLGRPAKTKADNFCYQAKNGHAFLVLTRMVEVYDARIAGVATLSSFRNCVNTPVQVTQRNLRAWKTEKGIGLGSTAADLQKAYGSPSAENKIEGDAYRHVIYGDFDNNHFSNKKRPGAPPSVISWGAPS